MSTNDWIDAEIARLRPDLAEAPEAVNEWLAKVQRMLVAGTAEEARRLAEEVARGAWLVATRSYERREVAKKLAEQAAIAAVRTPSAWPVLDSDPMSDLQAAVRTTSLSTGPLVVGPAQAANMARTEAFLRGKKGGAS